MGQIDIEDLSKVFDDNLVAVDDLDLTIEDGEFLVLVGPSGCGKSTTLRCIAGLEKLTSGDILLDGESISNRKPKERDIAMVFQNYALYPHKTARENMSFGLRMTTDLSDEEIKQKVDDTAAMMGIRDLLDDRPEELSGGQQQRVALGRAIVRDPEAFLMDEPLSNLDAKLRTTMRTELQNLQEDLETTTIYVTHDQTEAMTMGDRIAVLDDGELQQVGTPLECYYQPENRFVGEFIGSPSMNMLSVTRSDGALVHDAFSYELPERTVESLTGEADALTLGIRPEDIEIADGATSNAIRATVDVVEPRGDVTHLYLLVGEQRITATISTDRLVQSGETFDIVFPDDRIHLFDANTGEALKNSEVSFQNTETSDVTA